MTLKSWNLSEICELFTNIVLINDTKILKPEWNSKLTYFGAIYLDK